MDKQIIMRWWRVPREEIPEGREERIDWLFSWWERIDAWVDEHRPVDLPPRDRRREADRRGVTGRPAGRRACGSTVLLDVDLSAGLSGVVRVVRRVGGVGRGHVG